MIPERPGRGVDAAGEYPGACRGSRTRRAAGTDRNRIGGSSIIASPSMPTSIGPAECTSNVGLKGRSVPSPVRVPGEEASYDGQIDCEEPSRLAAGPESWIECSRRKCSVRTPPGRWNRGQKATGWSMAEYRLPHDPAASAEARARIEDELASALEPQRLDDARLMTAELISNAVRHAPPEPDGSIRLDIQREPDLVRIVVRDGGRHMDLNEPTFLTKSDGHYGLFVVDALADRWGFSIDGDMGVWFEVDTEMGSRRGSAARAIRKAIP